MLRFLTLSALALALGSSAAPGSAYAQGQGEAEAEADPEGDPGAEAELEADAEAELEADAESEAESVDPADSLEGEPEEPTGRHYAPVQTPPILRTICHGRAIRRVIVEGARRVDDDDVLATIGLRRGIPCTDAEVAQAARALWGLGFFDDIVIAAEPVDEEINLIVRVRERPAIARIVFDGNDEVSQEDLDEKVTLRTGGILSVPDVRTNVTKIRDLYAEEGYFLARVTYDIRHIESENNEVEVRFRIVEGPEVAIRRIRFIGNDNVSDDELLGVMQTSETGFFSFLSSNNTFSQEAFDEDLIRLQAYYYDQGHLGVRVGTPRIELTPDRRHIDVTVPLVEGPRFRIGRLRVAEIDGSGEEIEPLGGHDSLREQLEFESGDWFSRSAIGTSLQALTRRYQDAGYARVEITPETALDEQRRIVDVVLSIQRGPLVRIERIQIQGNSKTRDRVIRREIQINEGDLYSQSLIELSQARITQLGYFERVDIANEDGSSPDQMVLTFTVVEKPTGTFQIGAGFSSIESFILTAQVQQQNLFGNGQSLALQLQLSGIRQLATVRFTEPYLFGSEWSGSLDVFKTISQFQEFNRDSTGGGLTFGHPILDPRLRLALGYRAELVDISARTGGLFGASGGSGLGRLRIVPLANLFRDGLTSSLRLSLTWDSRNNRLFASSGVYASYSVEVADRYLGSENVFVRHTAFGRFYQRLIGPFVFKLNAEVGLTTSRLQEGVPIFERFFLGGIFNVRGFYQNSLGPRVGLPRNTDPNSLVAAEGVTIGGNLQAFYQAEIEFPIIESVGVRGVVFTDGGNAWNLEDALCQAPRTSINDEATSPCGFNPLLRTSWGFGFRWFSPLGPLRFEWGLPFRPRDHEKTIRFEFTIGNSF